MLRKTLAVLAAFAFPALSMAQPVPSGAAIAPEFRLTGDVVTLPLTMVHSYPFVEAEINGVKGKLMLDTGQLDALVLNHNPLQLPEGRSIGRGNFGSGESFEMILRPSVETIRLPGGLNYHRVTTFRSQNAAQIERITPDFIGWLGYYFWDGYAVKFDYGARQATFYKGGPKAFLKGEKVIAAIPFTTPGRLDDPLMIAKVGDREFEVIPDTGQFGHLFADADERKHLIAIGAIKPVAGDDEAIDIGALRFAKGPPIHLSEIAEHPYEGAAPFAKAVGAKSRRIITLGFALLNQYKTVWDYPNKMLYLLKQ
ncbi:MAG: hypothetical protein KGJ57_07365 [Sphingomonadales bacterium]|nr:hypothetical protein [Sphingomonadales bacterium]MDE2169230.1 hypothetical protein [Sphingomonadales bacterium]